MVKRILKYPSLQIHFNSDINRLYGVLFLIFFSLSAFAQNGMVGDGFGGRLWYKPTKNYAVGSYFAFAYCGDSLYCWGRNNESPFGVKYGTLNGSNTPYHVQGIDNIKLLSAGYCVAVLKHDGTAWAWGSKLNTQPTYYMDSVRYVHSGAFCSQFIREDGSVWSVGLDRFGMFGFDTSNNGPFKTYTSPVKMRGITDAVRVANSDGSSYVLKKDGTVWALGSNYYGKLGINEYNTSLIVNTPIRVHGLKNIVDVKSLQQAAIALDDSGYVYTWGSGYYGNMGNGAYVDHFRPARVKSLKDIVAISAINDGYHFMALDKDKNCYLWGRNNFVYVGLFDSVRTVNVATPKLMATDVIDIMNGETFDYIIKTDGTMWALGTNMGPYMPPNILDRYMTSIWMNLKDTGRVDFTRIEPTLHPMNLCPPINENIEVGNKINGVDYACLNQAVELHANDTLQFHTFTWDFGDGTGNSGKTVQHSWKDTGMFQVQLHSIYLDGKRDTVWKSIHIYAKPNAKIFVSDTVMCLQSGNFHLADISSNSPDMPLNRIWKLEHSDYSLDSIITPGTQVKGIYNITLIVSNDFGCIDSAHQELEVVPLPQANQNVNNPIQCLESQQFIFSCDSNDYQIIWEGDNGLNSSLSSFYSQFPDTGKHSVKFTAIDPLGCTFYDTLEVLVKNHSTQLLTNDADTFCFAQQNYILRVKDSTNNLRWEAGDGFRKYGHPFNHIYANTGDFLLTVTSTDTFGCVASDSLRIHISPNPKANFVYSTDNCTPSITFKADQSAGAQYIWKIEQEEFYTQNLNYHFNDSGNYSVELIVQSADGNCSDTAIQNVHVVNIPVSSNRIPNVFTPDNNGTNDCFQVAGGISNCDPYSHIEIYNRWGVQVFSGNAIQDCWNGTGKINGQNTVLPSGTYFYIISYHLDDKKVQIEGVVELIR